MNLKRQLLLVSLLTLLLPWAGCQFIRETESALRAGQQQFLAGTARAIADSMAQYPEAFPLSRASDYLVGDQLYGHALDTRPELDGYFDDWGLEREALREIRGADGPVRFAIGLVEQSLYLYVEVTDRNVVYAGPATGSAADVAEIADRVSLVSTSPPYLEETLVFATEAPGSVVTTVKNADGTSPEPAVQAFWQDGPRGYQLEARIPVSRLGTHLGIVVDHAADKLAAAVRSASFSTRTPGAFVSTSAEITEIAESLVQPGMRLIVTDALGWRVANVGAIDRPMRESGGAGAAWLRIAYDALVESGQEADLAAPDAGGRERQGYIAQALDGLESSSWFRSSDSGRAVVAVAQPIQVRNATIGAVILQQGTEAILSLTNQGLARLMNVTMIATLLVASSLLGYATWLSRRIRRLSLAAEEALERDDLGMALPSASATDEVGDLSRSFSNVLRQLGDYNAYLRSLASKLSHELRTPLAIVTSSLEKAGSKSSWRARNRKILTFARCCDPRSPLIRMPTRHAVLRWSRRLRQRPCAARPSCSSRCSTSSWPTPSTSALTTTRSRSACSRTPVHLSSALQTPARRCQSACVRSFSIRWFPCVRVTISTSDSGSMSPN
jgi:HAMP domain-containing protein